MRKPLTEEQKEKQRIYNINYRKNNKVKVKEYRKFYYETNKEKSKIYNKNYQKNNLEKHKIKQKKYRENNKEKSRKTQNKSLKLRKISNPLVKLKSNIRSLISQSLKNNGFTKKSKTHEILGCSYENFKRHIESQWSMPHNLDVNGKVWMNWGNHGLYNGELNYGWDIDHKIGLCTAISESDIIKLNHYTNLQPLCSKINRYVKPKH